MSESFNKYMICFVLELSVHEFNDSVYDCNVSVDQSISGVCYQTQYELRDERQKRLGLDVWQLEV